MKAKLNSLLVGLVLFAGVHFALAQNPVITSFSLSGQLVCSNLAAGSLASVEWTASLSGPWHTNWSGAYAGLAAITVASNGVLRTTVPVLTQVAGPMFYRVHGLAYVSNPPVLGTNGMGLIPAGIFTMGNSIGDSDITDASPVSVNVSAFYLDVNLVSLSQWQSVYNYATAHGYSFVHAGTDKAANTPVETVDWYDCVKWCNARSQSVGLTPVYYSDSGFTQVLTNGESGTNVYANWAKNGYRLPTEAEWEKAARGGLSGQRFPWGNTITGSLANYKGDTASYAYDLGPNGFNPVGNYPKDSVGTSPVGSFPANAYGLMDMAGNLYEWCWDWYVTPYAGGTDPRGPVGLLSYRVLRGGYWAGNASGVRCANRINAIPNYPYAFAGFRCARGL